MGIGVVSTMKSFKTTIITIVLVFAGIFAFISFPWVGLFLHAVFQADPPMPKIKYGEFPFRIEYEINSERKVVEDTVICEFDNVEREPDIGGGKYRKWKDRLASGGELEIFLFTDGKSSVYYNAGRATYYMDDKDGKNNMLYYQSNKYLSPCILYTNREDKSYLDIITAEEMMEKYKAKLISWDFSEPIVNSFE